jgi:molecular chaperone GrpE
MTDASGAAASGANPAPGSDEDPDRVVIRDKRRVSGQAQAQPEAEAQAQAPGHAAGDAVPAGEAAGAAGDPVEGAAGETPDPNAVSFDPVLAELQNQVDERTADVQRVQAEYANYRKRMERDRVAIAETATAAVVSALLPVLDDIDRAREHGDLTGGLKAVADQLDGVLAKLGLEAFGAVGDPFDPTMHEAVTHDERDDVQTSTCTLVMRRGYRIGERLLRPAMVGVSDPA